LGALLGLGLGVGELTRGLLIARSSAPAWIETVRDECSAETRPILEAALSAHSRVVDGIVRASWLDSWERRESLALGSDLLAATARATRAADTGLRAALSLGQNAGDLEAHAELKKARVHILESLDEQIKDARRTAAKHAASLARLAVAVTERSVAFTLGQVELETRAEILEERVLAGTSWAVNS
jgi:hypothetical protein